MKENDRDRNEASFFDDEFSDEALEQAAYGKAITTQPTVPSAIICIPFEQA
jgi:hypothetical protein